MQKRIIALAVFGLMSGAAFAETSVVIGGKFDAGYQFKRTANADVNGGATGGSTTETMGDGSGSTSRITVKATEDLAPGWQAIVDLDLRFNGSGTSSVEGKGGLNSNDTKTVTLVAPFAAVRLGVNGLADQFYLAEKPYMVSPKDLEIVKYGIMNYRYDSLTSRFAELRTATINAGPVGLLFKGGYAIGDKRKDGTSNVDGSNSVDVKTAGFEYKVGNIVNGGADYFYRTPSTTASSDSFKYTKLYTSVKPVTGLKLGVQYVNQSGYGALGSAKAGWQDKITSFTVAYNLNDKLEIGGEFSKVRDVGQDRNSGRGYMFGAAYLLSKTTYVYAAREKKDWESNQSAVFGGSYSGTATNFTGTANKLDQTYTRVGLVKEF